MILISHSRISINDCPNFGVRITKFRAVNADNKSYVSSNVQKVLIDVEEKINQYMKELDEIDTTETVPGALTKENINGVLDYLERRKKQLRDALAEMEAIGENQMCTTDPE